MEAVAQIHLDDVVVMSLTQMGRKGLVVRTYEGVMEGSEDEDPGNIGVVTCISKVLSQRAKILRKMKLVWLGMMELYRI